jgi:hypothetical protein
MPRTATLAASTAVNAAATSAKAATAAVSIAIAVAITTTIAISAHAKPVENIKFECVTGYPTTSYLVRTEGKEVVMQVFHHNGAKYMPIHEGNVVPNDLPMLAKKAAEFPKMGEEQEWRFPLERCQIYGPGLMACHGGETKTLNGTKVEVMSVTTSTSTQQVYDYTFKSYKVSVGVKMETLPTVDTLTMTYGEKECQFNW